MEHIELKLTQDTDMGTIRVTAERNGQPFFAEEFKAWLEYKPLKDYPIHALSAEQIESTGNAVNSTSASLIRSLLADIEKSEKTSSKALYGQSLSKFELTSLIDIRRFEHLAGIRFDYSRFCSLEEFRKYYKTLIR